MLHMFSGENFIIHIFKPFFNLTFFLQLLSQRDLSNFHQHLQTAHEEKVKSDTLHKCINIENPWHLLL